MGSLLRASKVQEGFGNAEHKNHSLALQTCHLLKSYFKLKWFQQNTIFMSDGKRCYLLSEKVVNTQLRYL